MIKSGSLVWTALRSRVEGSILYRVSLRLILQLRNHLHIDSISVSSCPLAVIWRLIRAENRRLFRLVFTSGAWLEDGG